MSRPRSPADRLAVAVFIALGTWWLLPLDRAEATDCYGDSTMGTLQPDWVENTAGNPDSRQHELWGTGTIEKLTDAEYRVELGRRVPELEERGGAQVSGTLTMQIRRQR
jgi:hypothetical protein